MTSTRPLKAVIIQNYTTDKSWGTWMIDSIKSNIQRTFPNSQFDICHAEAGDSLPNISTIDLVVLTGGVYNLLEPELAPWVIRIQDFIKRIVEAESGPYIIGLCWGHQIINKTLGGEVSTLARGARVGIETIPLSETGRETFGRACLSLYKYHLRHVVVPAPGFETLGERNEILMHRTKAILTFQAHPEMTHEICKSLVDHDTGTYKPVVNQEKSDDIKLNGIEARHDGNEVWDRSMQLVIASQK